MSVPTYLGVDDVWTEEDEHLDLLIKTEDTEEKPSKSLYRTEIPTRTIQDADMSTTRRLFEKKTPLHAKPNHDLSSLLADATKSASPTQHEIPAATSHSLAVGDHSDADADAAAGLKSRAPPRDQLLYDPVCHLRRREPAAANPLGTRRRAQTRAKIAQVRVHYGTKACPEALRANQDYGYYSNDSVDVSNIEMALLNYDEQAKSEWPHMAEDPKMSPKKCASNHWTRKAPVENDSNNPTRRVKPSSHMTRFQSEMTKSMNDFQSCNARGSRSSNK